MIVHFSAEAEDDLEAIGDFLALENPMRALALTRELRAQCLGLAAFPERFSLVPRYEEHGVRLQVHGNHLIFYRVEAEKIVVIHVLHGAQDYASILFL